MTVQGTNGEAVELAARLIDPEAFEALDELASEGQDTAESVHRYLHKVYDPRIEEARRKAAQIGALAALQPTTADHSHASLRARVEELEKALRPFVAFADALSEEVPDEISLGIYAGGAMRFGPGGVTVEMLRIARAALNTGEGE